MSLIAITGAALGVVAFQRNAVYHDTISIWRDVVAKMPDNARAHSNLGNYLARQKARAEAISQYRKALELKPKYAEAHHNLGKVLLENGQVGEAILEFQAALEGDSKQAQVHYDLGVALGDCGRVDEAIEHYQQSAALAPDYADAHYNLAAALVARARFGEAASHYRTVLRLQPTSADACNNLARLLATCPDASVRNGAEAIRLARYAVEDLGSRDPLVLDTLAAAYAEVGRFPDAIRVAQQAASLAAQQDNAALVESIKSRIQLYHAGKPSREVLKHAR